MGIASNSPMVNRPFGVASDFRPWVLLSRVWRGWRGAVQIVKPATVVSWHRRLFASGGTIGDNSSQTVTVSNTAGSSVDLAGIAMSGDASFEQRNTCGSTLSAGATCTVTVTFSPSAYGIFSSTLVVTESSGAQETVSVGGTSSPDSE